MSEGPDEKRAKLRYAGVCRVCEAELAARVEAIYERSTKTVRCLACSIDPLVEEGAPHPSRDPSPPLVERSARAEPLVEEGAPRPSRNQDPLDSGTPGASARREYERRRAKDEAKVREKHPKLGGLILALSDERQPTKAWDTGAIGEERLGQKLNELASDTLRVLHDRRIPGTRANIDHIAVTSTGVCVIDPKRYPSHRPTLKVEGGLLRPRTEKLLVGGRDRTNLVDGVLKQVGLVRAIVGKGVPVTGVLCFIDADWPLIEGSFTTRGVEVLWPKKLYSRLTVPEPLQLNVATLHRSIAEALPPA
ncbi:nuclease-related domain-containing protein [Nocardioides baculatus]|uniref:NERD domain-containing protein n=1 Tax=Nocardioides baculatus TaxID=2801337 RepID=A0ABS1L9W3_9ACTN|nr:nuclease-related domain-containing protein [Nocardioides baculatus]MBL0748486.1 NERD domain-containing protein [Nocardioides baculatus]